MSQSNPIHDMEASASADPRWKGLYQLGGIAFIVLAFSTALAIIAFFIWPYEPGFVPRQRYLSPFKKIGSAG